MHLHVLAQMKQGDHELNRRTFFRFSFSALVGGTLPLLALVAKDDHDDQHGRGHGRRDDDHGAGGHEREKSHGGGYFRQDDTAYLRENYGGPVNLPPGLRKKYYRTGKLPPGWEKRFRPFPPAVIRRLPPPPPYCDRGYIDGFAVVYDRRTRVILDVIDLINVAAGR
jgi:hypothetical protein